MKLRMFDDLCREELDKRNFGTYDMGGAVHGLYLPLRSRVGSGVGEVEKP